VRRRTPGTATAQLCALQLDVSHLTGYNGGMSIVVRPAAVAECAQIADIYRHYVEHTVATFDTVPPTVGAWEQKLTTITAAGRPFLVAAADDDQIVGFAYLGTFRNMPAYDHTSEDTIYVRPGLGGGGIGSALMSRMLADAEHTDVRQIIAVIAATNGEASIALHLKHGFTHAGRLHASGHKAGQWIDTVYLQYSVGSPTSVGG